MDGVRWGHWIFVVTAIIIAFMGLGVFRCCA
jgi:cytochrome b subunit of formate dehydrogenase